MDLGLRSGWLRWSMAAAGVNHYPWVDSARERDERTERTRPVVALSKNMQSAVAARKEAAAEAGGGKASVPPPKPDGKRTRRGPDEDERAEDRELVRRIKEGEKDLFSRLVVKYHGRIFTVVSRILASPEDAEEATQDAFVAAYRKIQTFREQAQFYSWLYRIATNHALNRLRANRSRGQWRTQSLDEMVDEGGEGRLDTKDPNPVEVPDRSCEESEWVALIERALGKLAPMYRTVVVLRDVEGLTYEEIAFQTGLALGTVKSRLHAGRAALRRMLEQYGVG
jgi:RNA polymerase sigma-70 factor (ECF subfamily)